MNMSPGISTCLISTSGDKEAISSQLPKIIEICNKNKVVSCQEFTTPEQLTLLWEERRAVRPHVSTLLPNTGVLAAEVGVPISQVPELLDRAEELSESYSVQSVMFGHMGDGNFHLWALYELQNSKSWEQANKFNEELIRFALSVGGTTTGEHGLGIGKRKFLPIEHPSSISVMKDIKQLLDPNGILNPEKILPE